MSVVLVTGGSGFIASYCILQLLAAGHQVRTTVRSLKRESDVRAMLRQGGAEPGDRLSFFAAELEQDAGWREAVTGCDYVLHVASPLSQHVPKNEDEMIVPARDGTLRVLRAARDAGVKRVVLTSSSAAISYGHRPQPARSTRRIGRIRTRRRAPVCQIEDVGRARGLGFHCARRRRPRALCRQSGFGARPGIWPRLFALDLSGEAADGGRRARLPATLFRHCRCARHRRFAHPRHGRPCRQGRALPGGRRRFHVDPRDCAGAEGALGRGGRRVPTREVPNWLVRVVALFNPAARQILPELGKVKNGSGDKARRLLGWAPRSREDAIAATGESLLRLGLLKDSAKKAA